MPSYAALRRNLKNKVFGGRSPLFMNLSVTNTGTGLGTANYKIGMCVLDSSATDWFLCTATTGSGTWVKINA